MIIKIQGISLKQVASLALALNNEANLVGERYAALLKDVKQGDELGFQVTIDVFDKVSTGERRWVGNSDYFVQGYTPRKYVDRLFDALGVFPDVDEPVEIQ